MTASPTLIYLPGLHGTADLAQPFLQVIPAQVRQRVIAYPSHEPLGYDALLQLISTDLRGETNMVIVGESFAGPLALMFAATHPDRVAAVVLVATFARSPLPSWLAHVAPVICRLPLPAFLIRHLLTGGDASDGFVNQVRVAIRKPDSAVLCSRLKSVLTVDCTESLQRVRSPILYLAATRDHLVSRSSAEYICATRADVEIRSVQGPHLILQTAPAVAWNWMKRFWSEGETE